MISRKVLRGLIDRLSYYSKELELLERPLEEARIEFVKTNSILKIASFSLEEYFEFTRELETNPKIKKLGSIGATTGKYSTFIIIEKKNKDIMFHKSKVWGNNHLEAFPKVVEEIKKVLESGDNNDEDTLAQSVLPPVFKGKLLATYYPDIYLGILSEEFLNYYIQKLDIEFNLKKFTKLKSTLDKTVFKRKALLEIKNNDEIMKRWSNYMYLGFLIKAFGKPKNPIYINEDNFDIEEPKAWEGAEKVIKEHKAFERNATFINKAKKLYENTNPSYECQICGFSFKYTWYEYIIEAHHKYFISDRKAGIRLTRFEDLWFVCSNCHTAIHRIGKLESIDDYKKIMKKRS